MRTEELEITDRKPAEPTSAEGSPTKPDERLQRIKFTYTRSNYYREIISNGVFGGLTPDLDIHVALFNQHSPDFKEQIFEITENGALGPEIKQEPSSDLKVIAREIEIGITMNIAAAIQLTRWLGERIQEAAKAAGVEPPKEAQNDTPTVSS